jgi:hypothetical protein
VDLRSEIEQASAPPASDPAPAPAKKPEPAAAKKPEPAAAKKPNLKARQTVDRDGFITEKTKQQVKDDDAARKESIARKKLLKDSHEKARQQMARELVTKKFSDKPQKGRPSSYADSTVSPGDLQAHLLHCLNAKKVEFPISPDQTYMIDGCSWSALSMWDDLGFRANLSSAIKKLVPEAWISYGKQPGTIFISKYKAKANPAVEAAPAQP